VPIPAKTWQKGVLPALATGRFKKGRAFLCLMEAKKPARPRRALYKVMGTCRLCKVRFVVDKEKGHYSSNYCMTCVKKFNQTE